MSRVRPILFNTDMVQAILDESKTATRRILKLPKHIKKQDNGLYTLFTEGTCYENQHLEEIINYTKQPYQPGDYMYVREKWNYVYDMDDGDQIIEGTGRYVYYADDSMPFSHWVDPNTGEHKEKMPWRPSIHMPKAAARIWLKVKYVRVEHLQDMNADDLKAEGFLKYSLEDFEGEFDKLAVKFGYEEARKRFVTLWDSIIPAGQQDLYGWAADPWVWAIEFERCRKPEQHVSSDNT